MTTKTHASKKAKFFAFIDHELNDKFIKAMKEDERKPSAIREDVTSKAIENYLKERR